MSSIGHAADPFQPLPNDILVSIFSFLPLRPRLSVVSLVSKRWHTCTLKSLTNLGMMEFELEPARVARLPSITDMCARNKFAAAELPVSLRCLAIVSSTGLQFDDNYAAHLRLLDCLKCFEEKVNDETTKCWQHTFTDFVPKYRTQLQQLWLHDIPSLALSNAVQHYPHLSSLSLSIGYGTIGSATPELTAVGQLLALHNEQLTELSLAVSEDVHADELSTMQPLVRPMRQLRNFHFSGNETWLLSLAPLLVPQTCKVSYSIRENKLTEELCAFASSVNLTDGLSKPELLARCTNLSTLVIYGFSDEAIFLRHAAPASVRDLTIKKSVLPPAEWLASFQSLERLKMDTLPVTLCVTNLVRLCIDWMPYINSQRGLLSLCDVISACPRLTWFGSHWIPYRCLVVRDVETLAQFAIGRGVEEMRIQVTYSGAEQHKEPFEAKVHALKQVALSLRWLKLHLREYTVVSSKDYDGVETMPSFQ